MSGTRVAVPRLARRYAQAIPDPNPGENWESLVVETAFHEAAHGIVATHCGLPPRHITIEQPTRRGILGRARWPRLHLPSTRMELRDDPSAMPKLRACGALDAMTSLAGPVMDSMLAREPDPVAHVRWLGERENSAREDVCSALRVLRVFEPHELRRWAWLEHLARRTRDVLERQDVREQVDRLAEQLLNLPTLAGIELDNVLPVVPFDKLLEP